VNSAEGAQVRPKRRTGPFTGVAVPVAAAIPVVITRPVVAAVAHRGMGWGAAVSALPVTGVQERALQRDILGDPGSARTPVRMVTYPKTLLPRLARDHPDAGWALMGVGAVPLPFSGASAWRIVGGALGRTCFPQRSGRVHRPPRRCRPAPWWGRSRSRGLGCAAAAYGAVCVTPPTPARGAPWTRPWRPRAATAPTSPGAAGFSQRRARSAVCRSHRRRDSDRRGNGAAFGIGAVRSAHRAGIADHVEGGDVPARSCRHGHPITRRSESLS